MNRKKSETPKRSEVVHVEFGQNKDSESRGGLNESKKWNHDGSGRVHCRDL